MIALLVYGLGALLGVLVRLGSTRWAVVFVVSIILDNQRMYGVSITNVAMIAFLGALATEYLGGRRVRVFWLVVPMLVLVLLAILATALATDPGERAPYVVSLIGLTAASYGLAWVTSSIRRLETLVSAVLWMSGLLAVAVLGESILWLFFGIAFKEMEYLLVNLNRNVLQATGFFSSNALAAFHLVPGTALAGVLRSRMPRSPERSRLGWYLVLTIPAMIATFARAALVTLVVFVVVLLLRRAARLGWARFFAILVLVIVIALVPSFLRIIAGFNINSYVARYGIVLGALDSIAQHPAVGSGPGSEVVARPPSWAFQVAHGLQADDSSADRDTHNTVLQIAVDLGLIGVLWFTTVNVVLFGSASLWSRRLRDARLAAMLQALLIALFLTGFFSLFDSVLYTKPIWILFGLTAGAVAAARQSVRSSRLIKVGRHGTPGRGPTADILGLAGLAPEVSK